MNIKKVLLFVITFSVVIYSQNSIGIGSKIGGGFIKGNSPNQGSYFVSLFVDIPTPFSNKIIPRISFIFSQDFDKLLPSNSDDYHPFVKGYALSLTANQILKNNFYIEESGGLLVLNDRIFSNNSDWNYGVTFALLVGLDLKRNSEKGIKLGLGLENGFTFSNALTKYFSVYLQFHVFL